jgi:glycine/D-amino acid oxidase-like deaminating enzyme
MPASLASTDTPQHIPVIIVGGGQGGLSLSHLLQQQGIGHLILEKHRIAQSWRNERWDSFCLVTPNRQCRLPGFRYTHEYGGTDPHGFMLKDEIVAFLEAYAKRVDPPIREGVTVTRVATFSRRFCVETSDVTYTADKVIIAISGYHTPIVPRVAPPCPAACRRSILSTIATRRTCPRAACWWSARASRAARSPRICCWPGGRCIWRWAMHRARRANIADGIPPTGWRRWAITTCPSPIILPARRSARTRTII